MRDQTIAYNEAVADSTNQFFLLNVLRARDRFPLYYTRTTGNNASQGASAGAAVEVDNWHALPSAALGASGGNTVSLANLDDQKFMRGVLTPVPLATLGFYLDQGWPKEVVMGMFISRIDVDRTLAASFAAKFSGRCAASAEAPYCDARRPLAADGTPAPSPPQQLTQCLDSSEAVITFRNDPSDAAASVCFRAMLRVLIALGLSVSTGDSFTVVVPRMPAASAHNLEALSTATTAKLVVQERPDGHYAVCKVEEASAFTIPQDALEGGINMAAGFFDAPNTATTSVVANAPLTCTATAMAKPAAAGTAPVLRFTTRSLDSMLYYLGEDVRAGNSVTIWSGSGRMRELPLFVVQQGGTGTLVAIDYRGDSYGIPDECAGSPTCEQGHRSLQVLSLLNQIWGLQKEASEAPSVPVVSVINR
jgi:hypothetical protein